MVIEVAVPLCKMAVPTIILFEDINLDAPNILIPPGDYTHMWRSMGHFADNPMGVHWTGIVFGQIGRAHV